MKNIVGLGINDNIAYAKLDTTPILGIVCSTNDDGSKPRPAKFEVTCSMTLRSLAFSTFETHSNLRMKCPRDCIKVTSNAKANVFGTNVYTDNSSICLAAIHAGAIKASLGGMLEVTIEPGRSSYFGSQMHNITSLDYSESWDRSFMPKSYAPLCPINLLSKSIPFSSFVELSQDMRTQALANLIKQYIESRGDALI